MQRPWSIAYWLAPHGLLNLLSYRTQDHQSRGGPTLNGLDSSPPEGEALLTNYLQEVGLS